MPRVFEPKTIREFGGMHQGSVTSDIGDHLYLDNADLKDEEAALLANFNFTDTGGLSKRHGMITYNSNVQATSRWPTGTMTQPINVRPLAIQRRGSLNDDKLWFTDSTNANLWRTDLTLVNNATCMQIMRNSDSAPLTKCEWMIPSGSVPPAGDPYRMVVCRRLNGMNFISGAGFEDTSGGATNNAPSATHITLFKDRIFAVNSVATNGDESRVRFSKATDPLNFDPNDYFFLNIQGGDYLVATVVFNDQLIIFKSKTIWTLSADGSSGTWSWRNLHSNLGCAGRGTVQVIGGMIYFVGNDGIYRTDGTSFDKISDPIKQFIFATADPESVLKRDAFYFDNKYIVGEVGASSLYVFDIIRESWSIWVTAPATAPANIVYGGAVAYTDIASQKFYIGDSVTNRIYTMNTHEEGEANPWQDNGQDYRCSWVSKRQTWDDPNFYKRNYFFTMDVGHTNHGAGRVSVYHKVDPIDTDPNVVNPNGSPQIINVGNGPESETNQFARRLLKMQGAGYGRAIETNIDYTGSTSFDIFSVTWMNATKDTVKRSN